MTIYSLFFCFLLSIATAFLYFLTSLAPSHTSILHKKNPFIKQIVSAYDNDRGKLLFVPVTIWWKLRISVIHLFYQKGRCL